MSLQQRLAKLEQAQTNDDGAGIYGIRQVHWETREGPDVVKVMQTGERLTVAEWRERYPRGLLVHRLSYLDTPPTDDEL